ncbi:BRCT domain-containing protein [Diplonema papillatum]|nr:BRCT domain-containing protein [Diplonema papillatum]
MEQIEKMPRDLAVRATVKMLRMEVDQFATFYLDEVGKIEEAAKRKPAAVEEMYEKKKSMCMALSEARSRLLELWEPLDKVIGSVATSYNADVLTLVRKDNHKLLSRLGVPRSSPVVTTIGYHGKERDDVMNAVLNLGGGYSRVCSRNTVTHILVHQQTRHAEQKGRLQVVSQWDVPLVPKDWLDKSVGAGRFVDAAPYRIKLDAPNDPPAGHQPPEPPLAPPKAPAREPSAEGGKGEGDQRPATASSAGTHSTTATTGASSAAGAAAEGSPDAGRPRGRSTFGPGAFHQAVEELCAEARDGIAAVYNPPALPPVLAGASQLLGRGAGLQSAGPRASHKRTRVSRKELLSDAAAPPWKQQRRAGSSHPLAKPELSPGTANSGGGIKQEEDATDSPERLPEAPPAAAVHPLRAAMAGGPSTAGVESQLVKWDHSTAAGATQKNREVLRRPVFQLAGGGTVSKPARDALVRKIEGLGGTVELVPKYIPRATHLLTLSENQLLTEKYLSFVASGKWIVRESYVNESHAAGKWLNEEQYCLDGPDGTIAHHRCSGGQAFKDWKVVLLLESGGIQVILNAGGCSDIWTELTPDNAHDINYVLTDAPGELTLPTPKGVSEETLEELKEKVFSIEILYRLLCISIDEAAAKFSCALPVTFI